MKRQLVIFSDYHTYIASGSGVEPAVGANWTGLTGTPPSNAGVFHSDPLPVNYPNANWLGSRTDH